MGAVSNTGGVRRGAGRPKLLPEEKLDPLKTIGMVRQLGNLGSKAVREIKKELKSEKEEIRQKAAFKIVDKLIPEQLDMKILGQLESKSGAELTKCIISELRESLGIGTGKTPEQNGQVKEAEILGDAHRNEQPEKAVEVDAVCSSCETGVVPQESETV